MRNKKIIRKDGLVYVTGKAHFVPLQLYQHGRKAGLEDCPAAKLSEALPLNVKLTVDAATGEILEVECL